MHHNPLHTAIALALAALASAPSHAVQVSNAFTFETFNQSLWSSGGQAGWGYNSGFIGGTWGGGATAATPVQFGINGIAGEAHALLFPAIPPVYGDTRTGGSGMVKSSGALGFSVQAGANGGAVAVTLPYAATLLLPDKFVAGQLLRVAGTGRIDAAGASIAVDAPSFRTAVNGIINATTTLSGKGCFVGAGCTEGGAQTHIDTQFEIVSFDPARSPAAQALNGLVPLPVKLGEDLPITVGAQTVGHVTINAPRDQAGGTVAGKTLSLHTNDTLLRTTADFGRIAQTAMGLPDDVLQPAIDVPGISIGGTVVNLQGGVQLGLSQHLAFEANVDVTLTFDEVVYDSQGMALGKSVRFDIDSAIDIQFKQQPGHLSDSFSMGGDSLLSNDTGLSVDPLFAIQAGCFSLSVASGGVADVSQCAFDQEYGTTDLVRASVFKNSFALQGFNEATYNLALAPVPEPQIDALLLAGLALIGALVRRRAAAVLGGTADADAAEDDDTILEIVEPGIG